MLKCVNAMSSVLKVHKALLILYTVGLWSKLSLSKFGYREKLQRQVKQKIKIRIPSLFHLFISLI